MDLRKPRSDNVVEYHQSNAKESMPVGAVKRKPNKAGRWRVKKPFKNPGVSFSMTGPCSGELADVMTLGMQLARAEMEKGNLEYAKRILKRLKRIPLEYEREALLKRLGRQS